MSVETILRLCDALETEMLPVVPDAKKAELAGYVAMIRTVTSWAPTEVINAQMRSLLPPVSEVDTYIRTMRRNYHVPNNADTRRRQSVIRAILVELLDAPAPESQLVTGVIPPEDVPDDCADDCADN